LSSLGDNGGLTETYTLLLGSPAIDTGDPSIVFNPAVFDQRGPGAPGYARVVEGRIDIGAVESQAAAADSADFDTDGDIDGDIDGADFLAWQRGFGTPAPLAAKTDGDADNDNDVDGDDLGIWEGQFGITASLAVSVEAATASISTASVVEPVPVSGELVDGALAVAVVDEQPDRVSNSRALVDHSPLLDLLAAELLRRNDLTTGPNVASDLIADTTRDERDSSESPSKWIDALDKVFASVF